MTKTQGDTGFWNILALILMVVIVVGGFYNGVTIQELKEKNKRLTESLNAYTEEVKNCAGLLVEVPIIHEVPANCTVSESIKQPETCPPKGYFNYCSDKKGNKIYCNAGQYAVENGENRDCTCNWCDTRKPVLGYESGYRS